MNSDPFTTDDSAVAPVIGVILMIAITVLLAATVGAFVTQMDTPDRDLVTAVDLQVTLQQPGEVTIDHEGGNAIPVGDAIVVIDGATASSGDPNGEYSIGAFDGSLAPDDKLTAATTVTLEDSDFAASGVDFRSASITIIREGSQGRTITITEWEGPDA